MLNIIHLTLFCLLSAMLTTYVIAVARPSSFYGRGVRLGCLYSGILFASTHALSGCVTILPCTLLASYIARQQMQTSRMLKAIMPA